MLPDSRGNCVVAGSGQGGQDAPPDMRGYGQTDAPPAIEDYTQFPLVGDVVGLVQAPR
jgi:pimeloyl-ACP methyl ester carboxylesterase